MRNTWCSLLVVQVLAMRAATMPQGPRVPHNPHAQQINFGTHSVAERPAFRPHPSIGRPFFRPNLPKRGSASDPNPNGQALAYPPNFDAQQPPASRTDFGSENQIIFPDSPALPSSPPTPKPAAGTNPLGTRILISTPCTGTCMTKRSGRCELDAGCLFG